MMRNTMFDPETSDAWRKLDYEVGKYMRENDMENVNNALAAVCAGYGLDTEELTLRDVRTQGESSSRTIALEGIPTGFPQPRDYEWDAVELMLGTLRDGLIGRERLVPADPTYWGDFTNANVIYWSSDLKQRFSEKLDETHMTAEPGYRAIFPVVGQGNRLLRVHFFQQLNPECSVDVKGLVSPPVLERKEDVYRFKPIQQLL